METTIKPVAFVKYMEECYANQFLDGKLYFNSYKNIASMEDNVGRGDKLETVHKQYYSEQITIPLATHNMNVEAIRQPNGGYLIQLTNDDFNANMFCVYAVEDTKDLDFIIHELPKEIELGNSQVFIRDVGEFIRRVEEKLSCMGLNYKVSPIRYRDLSDDEFSKSYFEKDLSFSNQKEVRIAFLNTINEPQIIDIGDIRNIAGLVPKGAKKIKLYRDNNTMVKHIADKIDDLKLKHLYAMMRRQMLLDDNCQDETLLKSSEKEFNISRENLITYLDGIEYKK